MTQLLLSKDDNLILKRDIHDKTAWDLAWEHESVAPIQNLLNPEDATANSLPFLENSSDAGESNENSSSSSSGYSA